MFTRPIPSSGEQLPVIGLGTWQSFDQDASRYPQLRQILAELHQSGGKLIDTSPMYGRAEKVIGEVCESVPGKDDFFYATKVWTTGAGKGKKQIENSYLLMKREVMDLVQVHNLVDWKTHLPWLRRLKENGSLRYIGITHYQDSSHDDLARIIRSEPIDFVQFNYSILSRHAEKFLLPLCADKAVATLVNRPFGEGALFQRVRDKTLPAWACEWGIESWSVFFLKFILSHPAVTCVIPATSNPVHARENLKAAYGPLPDEATRKKMCELIG